MNESQRIASLDEHYPPCGRCMYCGGPDKRHRLWDAFMSFADAGYSAEQIQQEYPGCSIEHVRLVLEIRPWRRRKL